MHGFSRSELLGLVRPGASYSLTLGKSLMEAERHVGASGYGR